MFYKSKVHKEESELYKHCFKEAGLRIVRNK